MSTGYPEALERRRMPLQEFLAMPDGVRAEYVDGEAIMSPPAGRGHNKVQRRLANVIEAALPGVDVSTEAGIRRSRQRYRIPDVAVFAEFEDVTWSDQVPVLVVEVLSHTTRSEDTVRKSHEYAVAGIAQYWVVDREHATLAVYANNGDGWDLLIELDAERPRGEVTVGEYGVVVLDLDDLLRI